MRWEMIGALGAGVAMAGAIVVWPRPALICLGLISLLLGLLGMTTLKAENIPALGVAVIGGIGLIGFGALVGIVEALLKETRRLRPDPTQGANALDGERGAPETRRDPVKTEVRIEPKL